ncbi:hypothetical protein GGS20DRAFT_22276 [Poronia punctata]|nr:hypothetical protein GGS20DRAFT_22276 [Poronia punctata]
MTMDPPPVRKCKWLGCHCNVMPGQGSDGVAESYCPEHRKKFGQCNPPSSAKDQPSPVPLPHPLPGPVKRPATAEPANRVAKTVFLQREKEVPKSSPATNPKKQLPAKYIARKSTQQPSVSRHPTHSPATHAPPKRKFDKNMSPTAQDAAKRPRLCTTLDKPNASDAPLDPGRRSLFENIIPQPVKRGISRQSEEKGLQHSAIDDFALRPRKNEVKELAESRPADEDQRRPHRASSQIADGRSTPNLNGNIHAVTQKRGVQPTSETTEHQIIDLTGEDEPEALAPRSQQTQRPPARASPAITYEGHSVTWKTPSVRAGSYTAPSPTPITNPESQHNAIPLASGKRNNISAPESGVDGVDNGSTLPQRQDTLPVTELDKDDDTGIKATKTTHAPLLNEKNLSPSNSSTSSSSKAGPAVKQASTSIPQFTPTQDIANKLDPQVDRVGVVHKADAREPTAREKTPTPAGIESTTVGPLTALLGGRKWVEMTPEDRRLFWISIHDPVAFDAAIYSENNRPFRPGDSLFGLPECEWPPRPTRPAKIFQYIDPRLHYSHHCRTEEWHEGKQAEITDRWNRKKHVRELLARRTKHQTSLNEAGTSNSNGEASNPQEDRLKSNGQAHTEGDKLSTQEQTSEDLPKHVRDHPKWVAALAVLKDLEAQARSMRTKNNNNNTSGQGQGQRKAKSTIRGRERERMEVDDDLADIESD